MPEFYGTLPQWLSAAAACVGVGVAINASRSWRSNLREKRTDELLTSVLDISGEVGAAKDAIKRRVPPHVYGTRVDALFASLQRLQKAYVVAQRAYALADLNVLQLRGFVERTADLSRKMSEPNRLPNDYLYADNNYHNLLQEVTRFNVYVRDIVALRPGFRIPLRARVDR